MTGEKRREQILSAIQQAPGPVPGAALAQACHVSRQVIVQDIALLRAARYPILSTTWLCPAKPPFFARIPNSASR